MKSISGVLLMVIELIVLVAVLTGVTPSVFVQRSDVFKNILSDY